jgi:hypothetical protein
VYVPGPVLGAEDVPCLRDMGEQRIVAQMLPMMRIEATEGPLDLRAGAHDGPVHVNRQPRETPRGQGLDDEIMIEFHERREPRLRELLEPVAHGPGGRETGQAAEPRDQRIAGEILQMLQSARSDVEQPDHQQREARAAVVTRDRGKRGAQTRDDRQFSGSSD